MRIVEVAQRDLTKYSVVKRAHMMSNISKGLVLSAKIIFYFADVRCDYNRYGMDLTLMG